jgi:hypothetical protein
MRTTGEIDVEAVCDSCIYNWRPASKSNDVVARYGLSTISSGEIHFCSFSLLFSSAMVSKVKRESWSAFPSIYRGLMSLFYMQQKSLG